MTKLPKFSAEEIVAAIEQGHTAVGAARILHCDRITIARAAKRCPSVAAAIAEERERLVDVAELALLSAVQQGAPWAVSLVLKTLGKSRGYVERTETTGKDGGPLVAYTPAVHSFDHDAYARIFDSVLGSGEDASSPNGYHT